MGLSPRCHHPRALAAQLCPQQRYTESPRLACIPHELKSLLLMVALVVVALVVVNVTFLLLGLHLSESHAETVRAGRDRGVPGAGRGVGMAPNFVGTEFSPAELPLSRQVLRMTIHELDGEGSPQQLAMSKKERSGTFAVRDGLNATATVVYDYSKVRGDTGTPRWQQDRAELSRLCLRTAAGGVQVLASPSLLHHPCGQGQLPGAGRGHRELPAPAGERGALGGRWNSSGINTAILGNVGLGGCHLWRGRCGCILCPAG